MEKFGSTVRILPLLRIRLGWPACCAANEQAPRAIQLASRTAATAKFPNEDLHDMTILLRRFRYYLPELLFPIPERAVFSDSLRLKTIMPCFSRTRHRD